MLPSIRKKLESAFGFALFCAILVLGTVGFVAASGSGQSYASNPYVPPVAVQASPDASPEATPTVTPLPTIDAGTGATDGESVGIEELPATGAGTTAGQPRIAHACCFGGGSSVTWDYIFSCHGGAHVDKWTLKYLAGELVSVWLQHYISWPCNLA